MKIFFLLISLLFIYNCSLNNNSNYWTEDPANNIINKNILNEIFLNNKDVKQMTFNEYKVYLEQQNKNLSYPDIK